MFARYATLVLVFTLSSPLVTQAQTTIPNDGTPAQTRLGDSPVSVPMESWGLRPIVQARVNGAGPFRFILDTGTTFAAVLDDSIIKQLELPKAPDNPQLSAIGETGAVMIKSLMIGDAEFVGVETLRTDFSDFMAMGEQAPVGILGMPLFRNCLLTLDFPSSRVIMESGRLPLAGEDIVPLSEDLARGGILTIAPVVAGTTIKAHIDTGSPGVLTLLSKWKDKLPLAGKPRVVGMASTPSGPPVEISTATLEGEMKIGRHVLKNPKIDFADLGPMLNGDCGNVGSGYLKDFSLTVDQRNSRIRLIRGSVDDGTVRRTKQDKSDKPCRIGVAIHFDHERWFVQDVLAGGAGDKAGLRAGDEIVSLNGKPVSEMESPKAREIFSKPKPIAVMVRRGEQNIALTLTPLPAD